ncbi:MAG: 3-methyl-2-oxobutanoate dehydrogenase subunit VorB [Calditrichia bacterium]|jgi:2-oxoisovalerate ferredoxin oxidoreductase alpha subunit
MAKELLKGNYAVVKGAVLAGCRLYFGYPITPASEIAEAAAYYLPLIGGTFIQAESEVAAVNMLYGAVSGGIRAMTASSSPGMSLKQEGISYAAGAELPIVAVDVVRGGPGLGNIAPEQSDYNQIVKGGGHGNYKNIVLAPNSAQEMCDLTMDAFDLAFKYRNPTIVLTDGFIGQMMEPVEYIEPRTKFAREDWAVYGDAESKLNLISSIFLDPDELEEHNRKLQQKYQRLQEKEVRYEDYYLDDAKFVIVAYGIVSRMVRSAVEQLRNEGLKVGMLRPITLFPFPKNQVKELADRGAAFLVTEMSNGQLIDDIRLSTEMKVPVHFYNRMGGNVPSTEELVEQIKIHYQKS